MDIIFFTIAAFLMAAAGIYLNWTSDKATTGDTLGAHRITLAVLPAVAAVCTALALPDQAHIAAIGFGVWAIITWAGMAIMYRVRKDKTSNWYRTYTALQSLWLGIGQALGSAAIAVLLSAGVVG